jgi:hypothetical protein
MKFDNLVNTILESYDGNEFYLRFGDLPKGDYSGIGGDYLKDNPKQYEKGLSCYWVKWNEELQRWSVQDQGDAETIQHLLHRPIYLVKGEEIGFGSDGEPVLKKSTMKILAKLNPNDVYADDINSLEEYPRLSKPEPQWEDLDKKVKIINNILKNFDNEQNRKTGSGLLDFYRTELLRIREESFKRSKEWAKTHVLKSNVSPDKFI